MVFLLLILDPLSRHSMGYASYTLSVSAKKSGIKAADKMLEKFVLDGALFNEERVETELKSNIQVS